MAVFLHLFQPFNILVHYWVINLVPVTQVKFRLRPFLVVGIFTAGGTALGTTRKIFRG